MNLMYMSINIYLYVKYKNCIFRTNKILPIKPKENNSQFAMHSITIGSFRCNRFHCINIYYKLIKINS